MGTPAPRAGLVWGHPMCQHGGRTLLTIAVGRHDHALEQPHRYFSLLRVWCSDCDICLVGVETGREGTLAVVHVRTPNSDRRGNGVGEHRRPPSMGCKLRDRLMHPLSVFQQYGYASRNGASSITICGYVLKVVSGSSTTCHYGEYCLERS